MTMGTSWGRYMTGMEHETIHPIIDVEMLQSEQQSIFTNEVCSGEH